jgi:hypothetical protein
VTVPVTKLNLKLNFKLLKLLPRSQLLRVGLGVLLA